ncbi:hypothetical protein [Spirosoma arcticum]
MAFFNLGNLIECANTKRLFGQPYEESLGIGQEVWVKIRLSLE